MKRILLSLFTITLVITAAAAVSYSQFVDTEEANDNTFATGNIDLEVDGENGPFEALFSADGMVPGETYPGGCVDLTNVGTTDGLLTLEVSNAVSNENSELEPELSDGDVAGTEVDPNSYDANDGDGELYDQLTTRFFIDDGAGSHTGNGVWDWDDTSIYSNHGTPSNDYSSTYSLPLESDLVGGNITLAAGETVSFCTDVHFVDDTSNRWWGGQSGLTNNMAMSDDVVFDLTFGLEQVTE